MSENNDSNAFWFWIGLATMAIMAAILYFISHASIHVQWEWKP